VSEPLTPAALTDTRRIARILIERGVTPSGAAEQAQLLARCASGLIDDGANGTCPARALFVPGRIELLGTHTDYAGGRSLIAAVQRGFATVAVGRDEARVDVLAVDLNDRAAFDLSADLTPPVGHWSNYPMTVARRLASNFSTPDRPLRGATMAMASNLPIAAGMSSSSAMVVSAALMLSAVNDLPARQAYRRNIQSPESLAEYLATIENGQTFGDLVGDKGVGTFGGSEDHTAMLCCGAGELSQYSYCPVRLERRIAWPEGYVFAVAASGVEAAKTGEAMDKYNRASHLASAVTAAWNAATGRADAHMAAALASSEHAAERMKGALADQDLRRRFDHFRIESEQVIPAAGDALAAADLEAFGRCVDRSQEIAQTLLGNQVPETVFLARTARQIGAVAAKAFGAGFGGSVWALVAQDRADGFLDEWRNRYEQSFAQPAARASFFTTRPGPAAFELA